MSRKIEEVEDDAGVVTRYRRHANGGGLVAPGAQVDESAFIGATTYIEVGARVGRGSWIGGGNWIDRDATIGHHVFIGEDVHVGRGAVLGNEVRIGSHSRVGVDARIGHGVKLNRDSKVPDAGVITVTAGTLHSLDARRRGERPLAA